MSKKSIGLVLAAVAAAALGYAALSRVSISAAPGGGAPEENTGPG